MYEKHHIIPKSHGGSNRKNNISLLTIREHYIAHLLLVAIYSDCKKMKYALWYMCNTKRFKPCSRIYDRLREEFVKSISGTNNPNFGIKLSAERVKRMSEDRKGKPSGRKGKPASETTKMALRKANIGRKHSPKTLEKLKEVRKRRTLALGIKGVCNPFINPNTLSKINLYEKRKMDVRILHSKGKVVLQFSDQGVFLKEWDSLINAERGTGILFSSIRQCCIRKSNSSGNFIWVFKEDYAPGENVVRVRPNQKTIYQFDLDNKFIRSFVSKAAASKYLKIKPGDISEAIRRNGPTKGFIFTDKM